MKKFLCTTVASFILKSGKGMTPENIEEQTVKAVNFVKEAVTVVKRTKDNPYGDADEAIAKEVLDKLEERRGQEEARRRG